MNHNTLLLKPECTSIDMFAKYVVEKDNELDKMKTSKKYHIENHPYNL